MKGHIRKRAPSVYAVIIDLPPGPDGKRRQRWHTVHGGKGDAERELTRLLHEVHTGGYVEPAKMTVGEFLEKWLTDYSKTNVSAKTHERYAQIVRNNLIPGLGAIPLPKLQPLQIQSFYSKMVDSGRAKPITETLEDGTVKVIQAGLSARTVLHFHRVLHLALQHAVKWQLLARNPADAVEPPKAERKEMRVISREDVEKLLESCLGTVHHMPIVLAIYTGMRRGEILALKWEDVDLENGVLAVRRTLEQTREGLAYKEPKTVKSRRVIALPETAVKALRIHKGEQAKKRLMMGEDYNDHGLVCCQDDGWPIPPDYLSDLFRYVIAKAGITGIRFHDLRHTHATILLEEGVHPKVVSERLGHSTIGITLDVYSHVLPNMQEEAARKLDSALRKAGGEGKQKA